MGRLGRRLARLEGVSRVLADRQPAWDLTRLTDDEPADLEALARKAEEANRSCGHLPGAPRRKRRCSGSARRSTGMGMLLCLLWMVAQWWQRMARVVLGCATAWIAMTACRVEVMEGSAGWGMGPGYSGPASANTSCLPRFGLAARTW